MIPVFITLYRFLVYFEIRLATTTRENVVPSGKDPVGANLYIHFPCLYCWRHRQLQRYNIREREAKEQRLSGKFCIHEQRIILMGFSLLERAFIWGRFQRFSRLKVIIFQSSYEVTERSDLSNFFLLYLIVLQYVRFSLVKL